LVVTEATAKSLVVISSVWPSAGAFAAVPAPMAPLAPGRFSTKNVWPSASVIFCEIRRAITSVGPPGG
jgi:hypothetical protein